LSRPRDLSRRELFSFWRRGAEKAEAAGPPAAPAPVAPAVWLRPPGAVAESVFADTCLRCGKCVEICPRECIVALGPEAGREAGTPAIVARRAPCVLCDGLRCTTVCPSGALARLALIEVDMGTAVVDPARCVTWQGEACAACHMACPVAGALVVAGAHPVVDADKCTGCGLCEFSCPTTPASIVVEPRRM
jgi:ferredoxin-type protein NapG